MSQLLTAEQLAERYQIPISQVYRLTGDGAIPAVRLGRYYRYRLDHLEQFEDSFTNNITTELRRAAA
jgi:excisionase family DNA binding protein